MRRLLFRSLRTFSTLDHALRERLSPGGWLVAGAAGAAAVAGLDTNQTVTYRAFAFLAVLLALMGFAFQPKSLFATVVWVSILSICALVAGALVQMERDTIISRLTNRPEGEVKFDSEFVQLLLRYVLLPLLLVATTQVPALADLIQDYLNPLMRLVR